VVASFVEDRIIETNFVTNPQLVEPCSVMDDIANNSPPIIKFATMMLSAIASLLIIGTVTLCCNFGSLEGKYFQLKESVSSQMREVGLPDDYEYDEDL